MDRLWLKQAGACACLLLLVVFVVAGVKYNNITFIFVNLQQLYSGSYGDSFMVALCFSMLGALVGRHFNVLFGLQDFVRNKALSPSYVTTASLLVATGSREPSPHRQLLVLLTFLGAMFYRFSGSEEHGPEMSTKIRLWSRTLELLLYTCFPKFKEIWCWQLIVPAVLLVSAGRTNEVFRIWRNHHDEGCSDVEQAKRGFQQLDKNVMTRLLSVQDIPWPSASSYYGYSNNRKQFKLGGLGIYMHLQHVNNQYFFLWVEGSGLLVSLSVIVVSLVFVRVVKSTDHVLWRVLVSMESVAILLYLGMQCLPGLIVRLDKAQELIVPSDDDVERSTVKGWIKSVWLAQIEDPWFPHIGSFARVLLIDGLPLQGDPIQIGYWKLDLRRIEGLELIGYVVVFTLARALARAFLICVAFFLRVTKLGVPGSMLWSKCRSSLACFAANLTAVDILKANKAIVDAEIALDSRKRCECQGQECITTMKLDILLGKLEDHLSRPASEQQNDSFIIDVPLPEEAKREAIGLGLFKSTQKAVEAVSEEGYMEIASRLRPILGLLKQFYIDAVAHGQGVIDKQADKVVSYLQQFCESEWNRYSGGPGQSRCVSVRDWKLMRAQVQASMLLFYLERPTTADPTLAATITAGILYDWLENRKKPLDEALKKTIRDCDFIS